MNAKDYILRRKKGISPFYAASLKEFWWYWNPLYGYFLGRYVFRPLNRILPYRLSVILTFAFCGLFLHDLPVNLIINHFTHEPVLLVAMTSGFTINALFILVFEKYQIKFHSVKKRIRPIIHISVILLSMLIGVLINIGIITYCK